MAKKKKMPFEKSAKDKRDDKRNGMKEGSKKEMARDKAMKKKK